MTTTALPESPATTRRAGAKRWYVWPAASLLALLALTGLWGARRISAGPGNIVATGKFYTVTPMDLDIKVRKDGELQAVNNVDVNCMVEGRSTIVYLVKEGENVKKGDLLVEIDSSTLRQSLQTATLEVKQAESDLRNSQEMLAIQQNQNAADLEAATVALELAKLALQQYKDGTYPQELADAETLVKMTEITVRNKEEDLEQTKALFAKGFVTAADVKQAELSVTTVHNDLRKAQTALIVLTKYKNPTDQATRQSEVSQADQKLARVRRTNASMLAKSQADVDTKQIALATKTKNLHKLEEQVDLCKIAAPSDGMVVYARDDDEFRMIEGAQVRERQRLIRLPDTSQMKAVVKVNESRVPKLRIGQRALVRVVGFPDPVGATVTRISPMADGSSRWMNPELREYPVELVLDRTLPDMKPSLTATAEIFVEQLRQVTAVPLASIYAQGRDSYVFARRGDDVEPVKVQIGSASETHAHLTEGLAPGQDVLVLAAGQGRQLLERFGIATNDPLEHAPDAPPAPPAGKLPLKQNAKPPRDAKAAGAKPAAAEQASTPTAQPRPADAAKPAGPADAVSSASPGVVLPRVPAVKSVP
jgi:HlyD family secretion protein